MGLFSSNYVKFKEFVLNIYNNFDEFTRSDD